MQAILASTAAFAAISLSSRVVKADSSSTSSTVCDIKVGASGLSESYDAYVAAGFDLATNLCDQDHDADYISQYFSGYVEATAKAYARAAIEYTINCYVSGSGSANVDVSGAASAEADAFARATLEGWASVSTCEGCDAQIDLFIESSKKVFVDAYVSLEENVSIYASNSEDSVYKSELIEDIQEKIITAYAEYWVDLYASVSSYTAEDGTVIEDQYCYLNAEVCAGTNSNICCKWSGDGGVLTEAKDAFANALVEIPLKEVCTYYPDDPVYYDFAKAVGRAYASSWASIYSHCASEEGGKACIWGSVSADAFAVAAAEATAEVWIPHNYCGCKPHKPTFVSAWKDIYASAYTYFSTDICVENDASIDVNVYGDAFAENFETAVAEVFVQLWTGNFFCKITAQEVTACAGTAQDNAICAGSFVDGQMKCSEDHECVKQNERRAVCKPKGWKPPAHWDGSILTCPHE